MKKGKIISTIILAMILTVISLTMGDITANQNITVAYDSIEKVYGDISYSDTYLGKSEIETIHYATKSMINGRVNPSFPDCFNTNNELTNVCANVAGANIINYFDRYFDDLIPEYVSGRIVNQNYIYYPMRTNSSKKQAVIDTLYTYMRTGIEYQGTTQAWFKQGLIRYVNEKGQNISYNSVLTNKNLDFNKLISQIESGNPIILYLSGFNITTIQDNGTTVTLNKSIYDNNAHIAIAYGYRQVDYYDDNGALIVSKKYLEIASGLQSAVAASPNIIYIVSNNGVLDDAEAVKIY